MNKSDTEIHARDQCRVRPRSVAASSGITPLDITSKAKQCRQNAFCDVTTLLHIKSVLQDHLILKAEVS